MTAAKQRSDVGCFTHAANRMRYDAPHQVGNQVMRKDFSENSLSGLSSSSQTHGPDRTGRAPYPTVESQMLMETEILSQTLVRTNANRASLVPSALVIVAGRINEGLSAFARRFMDALGESRRRQAEQVMRQYRDLIDDSHD